MENKSILASASKRMDKLPTLPGIAMRLLAAIAGESPNLKDIAAIISSDPPLTAKVLKLANSSFYGLPGEVASIQRAAILLGLNTVKNLALSFSLVSRFRSTHRCFDYADFWKDALIGALSAKWMAEKIAIRHGENLFVMGLLQDIGRLALMESAPQEYQLVLEDVAQGSESFHASERRRLGVDHLELGEHILRSWGLPASFAVPIRFHHFPEALDEDDPEALSLTRILHVSTLMIDLFKSPGSREVSGRLMHCIRAYGLEARVSPTELVEKIGASVKSVYPMFEIKVDENEHLEIVEAAKDALASLSNDLLAELQGQARKIQTLKTEADSDGLTLLDNHRKFRAVLRQEIDRAERSGTPLSLIMGDIDHFKAVNDTFGHLAGDHALSSVATWIREHLRDGDHAARYGGEEFAVILPRAGMESALMVAERLRKGIASSALAYEERSFAITMSFGVSEYDHREKTADVALIDQADQALYQAKRGGRNQSRGYRPDGAGRD